MSAVSIKLALRHKKIMCSFFNRRGIMTHMGKSRIHTDLFHDIYA